jgi:hypothetical protein
MWVVADEKTIRVKYSEEGYAFVSILSMLKASIPQRTVPSSYLTHSP